MISEDDIQNYIRIKESLEESVVAIAYEIAAIEGNQFFLENRHRCPFQWVKINDPEEMAGGWHKPDIVYVSFEGYWRSNDHNEYFQFPIEYLWQDNWQESYRLYHEERLRAKAEIAKQREIEREEERTTRERAQYLRLKEIYGNL